MRQVFGVQTSTFIWDTTFQKKPISMQTFCDKHVSDFINHTNYA